MTGQVLLLTARVPASVDPEVARAALRDLVAALDALHRAHGGSGLVAAAMDNDDLVQALEVAGDVLRCDFGPTIDKLRGP